MNQKIIVSTKLRKANVANACAGANAAAPFYRAYSLFWSVFGPAARYNFGNPEYAYAASLKP